MESDHESGMTQAHRDRMIAGLRWIVDQQAMIAAGEGGESTKSVPSGSAGPHASKRPRLGMKGKANKVCRPKGTGGGGKRPPRNNGDKKNDALTFLQLHVSI